MLYAFSENGRMRQAPVLLPPIRRPIRSGQRIGRVLMLSSESETIAISLPG